MSFREDGAAAVEWVASYLERVRDFLDARGTPEANDPCLRSSLRHRLRNLKMRVARGRNLRKVRDAEDLERLAQPRQPLSDNVRNPSAIEVEKVVDGALATGTFLEINSQPDRLDLRDANARLAGEAGVTLVISSDGHSAKALRYVDLGIAQARRAWLAKEQILNTRPWPAIAKLRT